MNMQTVISVVIVVVAVVLIAALIGISYAVNSAAAKKAAKEAEQLKSSAEQHEEIAAAEAPAPAEVPAEGPVEEPVEEPTEEPAEEPVEEPIEEPVEVPVEEPVEEPVVPAKEVHARILAHTAEDELDIAGEQLVVKDMSPALRQVLGVTGEEHDEEVYSLRYSYSFQARLILAPEEIRNYYNELVAEIASYKKMKRRTGRRQQIVSIGRKKVAVILFKGKKLCLALALDPKEFEGTKYRGKDVSNMKRFADTPMLFKVSTDRKLKYAKVLLDRLAEDGGLEKGEASLKDAGLPVLSREELIASGEIKVTGKPVQL